MDARGRASTRPFVPTLAAHPPLPLNRPWQATVSIIEKLLQADPAQRLGSHLLGAEVRVHPFFWGLAWDELESRQITPPHVAHCEERALQRTKVFKA